MDEAVLARPLLMGGFLLDLLVIVQPRVEERAVLLRLQPGLQRVQGGRNVPDLFEEAGDPVEFCIAASNDRAGDMGVVGGPVLTLIVVKVAGYDEDCQAALGECCVGGEGGEPPRLAGIVEQLAKYAAAAI